MSDKSFLEKHTKDVFVIAEAGVNHNGSFEQAIKLIDIALEAKADAIKFQTFKAYECAGKFSRPAKYQENTQSLNQFDLLKKLELPFDDFKKLKLYAESKGICFLSTPDGRESLDFLCDIKVNAIKVASGEITNLPFLQLIAKRNLPVILSTGMSILSEIQLAITTLLENGCNDLMLLHCTTAYPTQDNEVNILAMKTMKRIFSLPVGLSDHTQGNIASIMAVALGARIIEKHITINRNLSGPDHKASMPPNEFKKYVKEIRTASIMKGDGRKIPQESELETFGKVRRSLVASRKLRINEILTSDMISIKRPNTGIAPNMLEFVIGRKILNNFEKDEPICWENLGEKKSLDI